MNLWRCGSWNKYCYLWLLTIVELHSRQFIRHESSVNISIRSFSLVSWLFPLRPSIKLTVFVLVSSSPHCSEFGVWLCVTADFSFKRNLRWTLSLRKTWSAWQVSGEIWAASGGKLNLQSGRSTLSDSLTETEVSSTSMVNVDSLPSELQQTQANSD